MERERSRSYLLAGAGLLAAGLVVGAIYWAVGGPPPEPPASAPPPGPELTGARITGLAAGRRQWQGRVGVLREEEGDWVSFEQVDSLALYRDGQPYAELSAQRGRWHQPTSDLVLEGDVVLALEGGGRLRGPRLEYRARSQTVLLPAGALLEHGAERLRAERMELDLRAEIARFLGNVELAGERGAGRGVREVRYSVRERTLTLVGPLELRLRLGDPPAAEGEEGGS